MRKPTARWGKGAARWQSGPICCVAPCRIGVLNRPTRRQGRDFRAETARWAKDECRRHVARRLRDGLFLVLSPNIRVTKETEQNVCHGDGVSHVNGAGGGKICGVVEL
jgi:hypothetical protein